MCIIGVENCMSMKLYKTRKGIVIEHNGNYYLEGEKSWDDYVNDDHLYEKMQRAVKTLNPQPAARIFVETELEAPLQSQEIWACGVTYYRSKVGREEESKSTGGSEFYTRVYDADRPEIFFKSTAYRTAPPGGFVNIRKDSTWDVPEPELTLAVTSSGKIVGYTIGNDMSSRSIEGENPLYLPQAKTYDGSAAVGPCVYVTDRELAPDTKISMKVLRDGRVVFEGRITIDQIRRKFTELVSFLYRETSFPHGCLVMTGTGIVPSPEFTLRSKDNICITIDHIGTLTNTVK